jgi:hypothetical protein
VEFGCATMMGMKRSTAIGRLSEVAEELDRASQWSEVSVIAGYVYGALVDGDDELEYVLIALVVDEPAERVPWLSRPAHLEALAKFIRLDKVPIGWWWRPVEWPVWNHQIPRAACFWTRDNGRDERVIEALRAHSIDGIQLAEPADADSLRAQVEVERATARRHLASVTNSFGDRDWRRDHKGDGAYPEDALWAAAAGFVELDDWLNAPNS